MNPLTYREAGVDIDAGEDAVRRIASLGGFAAEGRLEADCALIGGETAGVGVVS